MPWLHAGKQGVHNVRLKPLRTEHRQTSLEEEKEPNLASQVESSRSQGSHNIKPEAQQSGRNSSSSRSSQVHRHNAKTFTQLWMSNTVNCTEKRRYPVIIVHEGAAGCHADSTTASKQSQQRPWNKKLNGVMMMYFPWTVGFRIIATKALKKSSNSCNMRRRARGGGGVTEPWTDRQPQSKCGQNETREMENGFHICILEVRAKWGSI